MTAVSVVAGVVRRGWLPVLVFFGLETVVLAAALVGFAFGVPLAVLLVAVSVVGLVVSMGSERWLRQIGSASTAAPVLVARPAQARLFTS